MRKKLLVPAIFLVVTAWNGYFAFQGDTFSIIALIFTCVILVLAYGVLSWIVEESQQRADEALEGWKQANDFLERRARAPFN